MSDEQPTDFPLQALLGFEIEHGDQEGWARLDLSTRHQNPNGVAHGSVPFALMDTAMGAATMSTVADGQLCATIEIQTRFIRVAGDGRLEAHATVINAGRRIVHLTADTHDDSGRLIATATGSFMILDAGGA